MILSRRSAMTAIGVTGLTGLIGCSRLPAPLAPVASADFMTLSRRLTGYDDLDATLGGRIQAIIGGQDHAFAALLHTLSTQGAAFRSLTSLPPALQPLATTILRAWQTGVVGEGAKAQVVSYEDTLMYRPIDDVCVLPTYARGEPHYWAQPLSPSPSHRDQA